MKKYMQRRSLQFMTQLIWFQDMKFIYYIILKLFQWDNTAGYNKCTSMKVLNAILLC